MSYLRETKLRFITTSHVSEAYQQTENTIKKVEQVKIVKQVKNCCTSFRRFSTEQSVIKFVFDIKSKLLINFWQLHFERV